MLGAMSQPFAPAPRSLGRDALVDELSRYLRPPGQGIHAVSTGRAELARQTAAYLGPSWNPEEPWRAHLARALDSLGAESTPVAMWAIPSDTGAGIVRGAARGPEAIRAGLGQAPVVDLGDVFSIPQLLDEAMLAESQRHRCQDALWPDLPEARRRQLMVSPMGMAARARALLLEAVPGLRLMTLGGDHTVSGPVLAPLLEAESAESRLDLGIVHFDAHTDLLPSRLGIDLCFATWAYHANVALGGGERMIQLGIRASGRGRSHWEADLDVRQLWGDECEGVPGGELAARVVEHLRARGVTRVYLSNDIDGTDAHWAAACGTPEPGGLRPEQVEAVIRGVGASFDVIGADLVELAPGLSLDVEASRRSVETAVRYTRESLAALAGESSPKSSE
ncbi:Arginase/agmatinase/formiminoglutamase [Plesiocystis pacifica SIR-1]|uniref:Arginase/agmatinase/formiminoglutamase n=2 Tax=Plesiocystis pacifica TaxID=191768 RepID=A6G4E9_9BACT|nr:Arginase/agmatinase/formiminoglutamase [Plesiocystis pacifica SIR-1]